MRLVLKAALKSFVIVKTIFLIGLIVTFYLRFYVFEELPTPVVITFFLNTGILLGYSIAYYSIKFINVDNWKKHLPLN